MKSMFLSMILIFGAVVVQAESLVYSKEECRIIKGENFCRGDGVHIVSRDIKLYDPRVPYAGSSYNAKYKGNIKEYGVADNDDLLFDELNDRNNISGWINAFYTDGTVQVRYRYVDRNNKMDRGNAVVDNDKISRRTECSHGICVGDYVYLGAKIDPVPPTSVDSRPVGPIRARQDIKIGKVMETFANGKIRIFRKDPSYVYESWVQPDQIMREVKCAHNVCEGADVKVMVEYTDGRKEQFSRTVYGIYSNGSYTAVVTRLGIPNSLWIDPIEFISLP